MQAKGTSILQRDTGMGEGLYNEQFNAEIKRMKRKTTELQLSIQRYQGNADMSSLQLEELVELERQLEISVAKVRARKFQLLDEQLENLKTTNIKLDNDEGLDNEILDEVKEDFKGPSLKEVVVEETNQLTEQHKQLSVRDLASKFDKNLSSAAKLSEEAKLREVPSLEGHVLLKKLRDALECLKGRLVGRNKEDVEKAISMSKF